MPLFEYSKWDGSQQFLPQSADKVFDQLAEYLLQHGERVLRNMDELEDEMPEIVELIQKEGLIEKDERGPVAGHAARDAAHPGPVARRPVPDLPPRLAGPARHPGERRGDGPARGHAALRLRRLAGQPRTCTRRSRTPTSARAAACRSGSARKTTSSTRPSTRRAARRSS